MSGRSDGHFSDSRNHRMGLLGLEKGAKNTLRRAFGGHGLACPSLKYCLGGFVRADTFKGWKTFSDAQIGTYVNREITTWSRKRPEKA